MKNSLGYTRSVNEVLIFLKAVTQSTRLELRQNDRKQSMLYLNRTFQILMDLKMHDWFKRYSHTEVDGWILPSGGVALGKGFLPVGYPAQYHYSILSANSVPVPPQTAKIVPQLTSVLAGGISLSLPRSQSPLIIWPTCKRKACFNDCTCV